MKKYKILYLPEACYINIGFNQFFSYNLQYTQTVLERMVETHPHIPAIREKLEIVEVDE